MRAWLAVAAIGVAAPVFAGPISGYTVFELRPAVLDESVPNPRSYAAVVSKLNANIEAHCGTKIAQWNSIRTPNEPRVVLVIEPHLTKIHFVGGNARFWLGPLKGNSDILSTVKIIDAAGRNVLAEDSFRGHGNGFKGTVTIGASDNRMIVTVAENMCDYIVRSIAPSAEHIDAQALPSIDSTSREQNNDLYAQLLKLDDLRKRGILTEIEFQAQKQKLLDGTSRNITDSAEEVPSKSH
jgi:hypothetical protein